MANLPPQIDPRTAADIENQLNTLLKSYIPDWRLGLQPDPATGKPPRGIHVALIKIFARFCEIIIERLNQVPQKNFLAFLDLLGASRLPPQPARAPLTFSLAKGATVDAVVPKGAQVAAQPTGDETEPVIFETEQDLVVTAVQLSWMIFVRDLQHYDDYSSIITTVASDDSPVFRDKQPIDEPPQPPQVDLPIERAFTNNAAIDLSTDFFPFGQQPKFGDTFCFANSKIFSQNREENIILKIELAPTESYSGQHAVTASSDLKLQWELGNGERWRQLKEVSDNTKALTVSGQIEFKLDKKPEITRFNGIENYWVRVRIVSGKYESTSGDSPVIHSVPPVIHSIHYVLPIPVDDIKPPSLYFGFTLPASRKDFLQRPMSLFISLAERKYSEEPIVSAESPDPEQLQLSWQYWNGEHWTKLTVADATKNFTRPGVITFLPPKDFTLRCYWLRVQGERGHLVEPKLQRVLLNTVMATQTVTVFNEVLGSSDDSKNQKFHTTRKPVLRGQRLEVRESESPSAQEQIDIKQDEGNNAISPILDADGHPAGEYWVRWHEVPDFYGSGPRDRHYVINHLTGEIGFGNGQNGLIPSHSKSNIRMAYYQTGGGKAGNKPIGAIVQLKTTVPYVDRVTNYEAATGGAEVETVEALIEQSPRQIRHHDRAVTLEDYEDLAREASPEVVRAKCLPLRHLAEHPLDETKVPGTVSVIIVPRSTDANPQPTLELISRVQDYLEARIDPTVNVVVVGPLYLKVDITTELVLTSLENGSTVEQAVKEKLASFLHPLTGGFDGAGWNFGRKPYQSDLYRLLEGVPGVDHVDYLEIEEVEDEPGAKQTNRFLIYSGKHGISLTFTKA